MIKANLQNRLCLVKCCTNKKSKDNIYLAKAEIIIFFKKPKSKYHNYYGILDVFCFIRIGKHFEANNWYFNHTKAHSFMRFKVWMPNIYGLCFLYPERETIHGV